MERAGDAPYDLGAALVLHESCSPFFSGALPFPFPHRERFLCQTEIGVGYGTLVNTGRRMSELHFCFRRAVTCFL